MDRITEANRPFWFVANSYIKLVLGIIGISGLGVFTDLVVVDKVVGLLKHSVSLAAEPKARPLVSWAVETLLFSIVGFCAYLLIRAARLARYPARYYYASKDNTQEIVGHFSIVTDETNGCLSASGVSFIVDPVSKTLAHPTEWESLALSVLGEVGNGRLYRIHYWIPHEDPVRATQYREGNYHLRKTRDAGVFRGTWHRLPTYVVTQASQAAPQPTKNEGSVRREAIVAARRTPRPVSVRLFGPKSWLDLVMAFWSWADRRSGLPDPDLSDLFQWWSDTGKNLLQEI